MLRSYVGTLDGEMKVVIARECYELSMRTLGMLYTLFSDNLEVCVEFVADLLGENLGAGKQVEKEEVERRAKYFIFHLLTITADTTLRRLTNAVGAQTLEVVFNDLVQNAPLSYRLMDFTVRLGTFFKLDLARLRELKRDTEKRILARSILTRVVLMHIYLFNNDYKTVQTACAELGISVKQAQLQGFKGGDMKRNPAL